MPSGVTIALITSGGALVGALLGAGISAFITKQQLELTFKQNKVGLIQSQIKQIQTTSENILKITTEIKEDTLPPEQLLPLMVSSFVTRATIFLNISYMFPKELETDIINILEKINTFSVKVKTNQSVGEEESRETLNKIGTIEKTMRSVIRDRLRQLQTQLDEILIE
jgi:hypothetical protein